MARRVLPLLALVGVFATTPAQATYSIVGADRATGEVGGTGTSCLRGSDVAVIYGAAPGFGVIHAQARANFDGRDRGVELLRAGTAPADVLAELTSSAFDPSAAVRQYGVVDAMGRVAAFTGSQTGAYAGDRQGSVGTLSFSVQGNILTGEAVLEQAAAAFTATGCDLAERLLRALEGGALNGEGDSRCTPDGIPADSSFIQVERPGTELGSYLELHVRTSGSGDPIAPLREQFDAWRDANPCPAPPDGGTGGTMGGSAGTSDSGGGAGTSGSGGGGAGSEGGGEAPRASGDSAGCGCRSAVRARPAPAAVAGGLLLLASALRRVRRVRGRASG